MNELSKIAWDVRVSEGKKDDQNEVFCMWENWFHIESSDEFGANEETSELEMRDED